MSVRTNGREEMKPMNDDILQGRLGRLRADGNQSLQRFTRHRLAVTMLSFTPGSRGRGRTRSSSAANPLRVAALPNERAAEDSRSSAAAALIDDERQIRVMAKQIKRLIVEDRRRGLGVGG